MAKYEITHTCCGVIETVQIYGPERDRDRRAAWLADKQCATCLANARAAENAASAAANASAGLPVLEGSEKQVAWAETIRAELLPKLDSARAKRVPQLLAAIAEIDSVTEDRRLPDDAEVRARCSEMLDAIAANYEAFMSNASAAWLIDCRRIDAKSYLQGHSPESLVRTR
jgi:hypothetical protein